MTAIDDCVAAIPKLTDRQRAALRIELRSATLMQGSELLPHGVEKDRRRAVQKVLTHASSLARALSALDFDAREYVEHVAAGGDPAADAMQRNARGADASRTGAALATSLDHLLRLGRPYASAYRVQPERMIADDVVAALARAGVRVVAADTGIAADCFRAVADGAGIATSDSVRYWIAQAKQGPFVPR